MKQTNVQKNVAITFDPAQDDKEQIVALASASYNIVQEYFRVSPKVRVELVYSREEMDELVAGATNCWFNGFARDGCVYAFSPQVLEEVSYSEEYKGSVYTEKHFAPLLTHEMTHLFLNEQLGKLLRPNWINEGFCQFVATQFYDPKVLVKHGFDDFSLMHTEEQWQKKNNYWQAHAFVHFLIDTFGVEKLFSLFAKVEEGNTFAEFCAEFSAVYGLSFSDAEKKYEEWLEKKCL